MCLGKAMCAIFLKRGWKMSVRLEDYLLNCRGEFKDTCKISSAYLRVSKISCGSHSWSIWDSLCFLLGLCLYDGLLSEQHDWEPVYVNRCIWNNLEWWAENFLFKGIALGCMWTHRLVRAVVLGQWGMVLWNVVCFKIWRHVVIAIRFETSGVIYDNKWWKSWKFYKAACTDVSYVCFKTAM